MVLISLKLKMTIQALSDFLVVESTGQIPWNLAYKKCLSFTQVLKPLKTSQIYQLTKTF